MSAVKRVGGLHGGGIDTLVWIANNKDGNGNIIKFFSEMAKGAKSAASSVDSSAGIIKKALAGISGGAKGAWSSLGVFGKVSLTLFAVATAVSLVVHVVDELTVSAAEAKENLEKLKNEYSENETELSSVNSELDETKKRIDELQSEGTLTFTEREELENLQNQNAELERQKSLLESIRDMKRSEIKAAFVQTMDKDVNDRWEYQGWGSEGPQFYSDRDGIETALNNYKWYTRQIEELDKEYANDLNNSSYLDRRSKLVERRQERLSYLMQKNTDFASASEGISYIQEPKDETERSVNIWLDYINDFQDKLNIALGGDSAKSHAFTRVITTSFNDVTSGLQELGKQGKVTWDMLQDAAYSDFVNKMIELGVIAGNDSSSLQLLADAFNGLGIATDTASSDTASGVAATETAVSKLKKSSEDTVKAINEINAVQKALASQESGKSISPSDFTSEELKGYASALEYVNGVYQLNAEKVRAIAEENTNAQIEINDTNKALAQQKYLENAKQIEKYRKELEAAKASGDDSVETIESNIESLLKENSALKLECDQYDLMSAALIEATGAYQNWINAKSAGETGDMFDGTLEALKQIDDTLNNSDSDLFGRIGREDYKAAVDFVVPDTVDKEDSAAVNSYLQSISDMFTYDSNGNKNGLNIDGFIQKSVDQGLLVLNEAGTAYEIAGHKTMEDFASGLGLAMPLVRAMFGELQEFGAKFDWADEASKTIGDLAVQANESAEALRNVEQFKDLKIVMDVSEFDDADKACETLKSSIEQMQDFKLKLNPDVDQEKLQQADDVIRYCVAQKQLLSAPAIMSVDVSKVTSEIAPALDLLQQFQNAQNNLEMDASVGADTSEAETKITGLVTEIQGLDPEILTKIGLDPTSQETIQAYINGLDAEAIVNFGVDSSLVTAFEKSSHTAKGTVNWYDNTTNLSKSFRRIGYVYWQDANSPSSSRGGGGGHFVNGSANAYGSVRVGTAKLQGDWRAHAGRSLVGELGREIIVDPKTGRWYTVGDKGAEFVNVPEGAIIFNHKQSDALLENGRVTGRGQSYVSGSAFVTGYIPSGIKYNGSSSSGRNPGYSNPSGGTSSSVDNNYNKELETFDWIEVAIDRIERVIERLGKVADSVFKSLKTRMTAATDEISMVTQEIDLQQRAYDKYLSAAESVSLSSDLKELVRNGAIDISQYDEDTTKLINDYKDLYDKALDCSAAIDDLHESLAQLYKDKFDAIQESYSNKLTLMQKTSDALSKKIDKLEEQGYMQNANYYAQMQNIEQQNIQTLNKELTDLNRTFNDAMASGEIEEGSDAWYEMKISIEDTKAAIDDAELSIIKYANAIRQISWDYFDYAQERVSQITSEADFLLNLLDGRDMYDENGNPSDAGTSSMGLRAEKYGVYMAQADKYADEIKKLNKELASDPNNKDLIERRDDLLASQRDSILAAKQEKEAMIDLAMNGIQVELDAIRELIDAYTESLDSAKDLYDYQKKIAEKTANISALEKQLAAYQNDMSEETRSKIQKIQLELKDAKDDLKDTEYDRFVSDAKDALDSMYDEYEDLLNNRFDDVDALFEKLIDTVNENYTDINDYISKAAGSVGYTITEATNSLWANGGGANGLVSVYGTDISTKLTSVGLTIENIFSVLEGIARVNGVSFGNIKSYKSGGLIDYTGIANVHGSESRPETVLNADDTKNFIMLRDAMRSGALKSMLGSVRIGSELGKVGAVDAVAISKTGGDDGYTVGSISVSIPIAHVNDYNDFVNQLRDDKQFEQLIQDVTIGRIAGKNSLSKNRHKW